MKRARACMCVICPCGDASTLYGGIIKQNNTQKPIKHRPNMDAQRLAAAAAATQRECMRLNRAPCLTQASKWENKSLTKTIGIHWFLCASTHEPTVWCVWFAVAVCIASVSQFWHNRTIIISWSHSFVLHTVQQHGIRMERVGGWRALRSLTAPLAYPVWHVLCMCATRFAEFRLCV